MPDRVYYKQKTDLTFYGFYKTIWDHLQSGKKRLTVFAGILLIAVLLFNGFYHLG